LGFELHRGPTSYNTCLAIDNEPSATRIYNANFSGSRSTHLGNIGRTADVCWFSSPAEIRLFYLSHIAKLEADERLKSKMLLLGFGSFLTELRCLDALYEEALSELSSRADFRAQVSQIESATYALASVKNILRSLGIKAFNRVGLDRRYLSWAEECGDSFWADSLSSSSRAKTDGAFGKSLWKNIVAGLEQAASKSGRGQHVGNAGRYVTLLCFLQSAPGRKLEEILTQWRSLRQDAVVRFVAKSSREIQTIYSGEYKVGGLLGGPPCKGFSRIGRPVANSLRDQGVFAWSSDEYGDERNKLVLHYVMFLEALKPDFFLFENVSNFQSTLKTPEGSLQADEVLAEAVANLSDGKLSYEVAARQVNAAAYAVPQSRIRYIMFGVNEERFPGRAKRFLDLEECDREITVSEAFFGLPRPAEFSPTNEINTGQNVATCEVTPPASDPTLNGYFKWVQQPIGSKRGETDGHIYRRMREDDQAFFQFVGPGIRWMDWELRGSPTLAALQIGTER
jgi:site-specific DNA-cytosine methylase